MAEYELPDIDGTIQDKGGRPKIEITLEVVCGLAKIHCTMEEMCGVFSCSVNTLKARLREFGYENFEAFMKQENAGGRASLKRSMWASALAGNIASQIFLAKNVLGMKDNPDLPDPAATKGGVLIAPAEMSPEAWIKQQQEQNKTKESPKTVH